MRQAYRVLLVNSALIGLLCFFGREVMPDKVLISVISMTNFACITASFFLTRRHDA